MMARGSKEINLLRSLYRELRPALNQSNNHVYETQIWKYIMMQCRKHQDQSQEFNKEASRNLYHTGVYFLVSIRGTNEYQKIQDQLKGKGERSAKDLATLLGFSMPYEPRTSPKPKPDKNADSNT